MRNRQVLSRRNRLVGPLLLAVALVAAGVGGRFVAKTNHATADDTALVSRDAALSSRIRIPMNIRGIDFNALTAGAGKDQGAFITAVKDTISEKGRIPTASVIIDEEAIESTHPTGATATSEAALSEFNVDIEVPAELSAAALIERLSEGDSLKLLIQNELEAQIVEATNVVVHSSAPLVSKGAESMLLVSDSHKPVIVLDIDVKGIYYKQLAHASADIQQSFVTAVQDGISATPGVDIQSQSIGLDISDGTSLNSVPFTHVTAKIPVPEGISADAFMSKWPQAGTDGIASQIKKNIEAMSQLESVSKSDAGVVHPISVTTSAFDLGGIRTSFATDITLEISFHHISHADTDEADKVMTGAIRQKVKEELMTRADVTENEIEVTVKKDEANLLRLQVVISARGEDAADEKVSVWEQKLLPAARSLQKFYKDTQPVATDDEDYRVMVGINEVKNQIDSVDMDVVIHGVDLTAVPQDRRISFLSSLAEQVRKGIGKSETSSLSKTNTKGVENYRKIRVAFDEGATEDTLNVRAMIPVNEVEPPLTAQGVATLMGNLEKDDVKTDLEEAVREADGVKFISTWTTDAIKVSVPGRIDDFAGDVVGDSDHL